jgi:hypothetical protein
MKLQSRFMEAGMSACVLALIAFLMYPAHPAPLPVGTARTGSARPAEQAAARAQSASRPSLAEVAALFAPSRPPAPPAAVKPAAPPESVPWLHYIAFVVGSGGQTTYFFKNDQTGRVLMLAYAQPREGWNLEVIQGDTYVLQNGEHRYLVTRK